MLRTDTSVGELSVSMILPTLLVLCSADWLVHPVTHDASVSMGPTGCEIELSNTLLARRFNLPGAGCPATNFGTSDVLDLAQSPPKSVLSALDAEAYVELDKVVYAVGGDNQTCQQWIPPVKDPSGTCAYLNRSHAAYTHPIINPEAFLYSAHTVAPITAAFNYTSARHAINVPWPPKGVHLAINFTAPAATSTPPQIRGVVITVHYELFTGLPAMRKWVSIAVPRNDVAGSAVLVGNIITETLRVNSDYAGQSYPIASAWMLGGSGAASTQPPLIVAVAEIAHGAR